MEESMSRLLVRAVVKRTLKEMKEDPDRGIRNLVDMARQFSDGRFQKDFNNSRECNNHAVSRIA